MKYMPKIIQIIIAAESEVESEKIYGLSDDGGLWQFSRSKTEWVPLCPPLGTPHI